MSRLCVGTHTRTGAGSFTTLASALTAAGLVDTLKDKAKLTAVLTYYVVPGKVLN